VAIAAADPLPGPVYCFYSMANTYMAVAKNITLQNSNTLERCRPLL
jgi:hypothetical protein